MASTRPGPLPQLWLAALTAVMVFAFTAALDDFWHMGDPLWRIALLVVAAAGFGWLHWRYPRPVRRSLLLGLPALLLLGLAYRPTRRLLALLGLLLERFVLRLLRDPFTTMEPVLAYTFLVLITALAAAAISWEALEQGDGFWSLSLGTVVFAQQWLMYYDNTAWFMLYATCGVALWAVARSARREGRWRAEGRRVINHSALGAAAGLCAGLVLFSLIAPSNFAPIDLGSYAAQLREKYPVLQKLRGPGPDGESESKTGFSAALQDLGGPVTPSLTPVLDVETDQPLSTTLYLRGDVRTQYTGKTWQREEAAPASVDAARGLPPVYAEGVPGLAVTAKLTSETPNTAVFTVLETRRVEGFSETLLAAPGGTLTARRPLAKGESYTLALNLPQVAEPPLRRVSYDDLAALRSQPEFAPYFQLPDNLPARVKDLAAQVTRGARTPYDAAAALEQYLRTQYTYTLEAPKPPADQDFVDFFLFDARQGYCTYYSSALVVLLRSLGIPARWVTGYAVAPLPSDEVLPQASAAARSFVVRDADAHAWVEVYFPGYGWVTFDPTPRYSTPFRAPTEPGNEASPTAPPDTATPPPLPPSPPPAPTLWERLTQVGRGVWATLGGLLLLGLLGVAVHLRLRRLAALPWHEPVRLVQAVWSNLERLMAQMGTERDPAETVREYAERLGREWPQLQAALAGMPELYAAARYGAAVPELGPEAVGRVRALWQAAEQAARARHGALGFYWRRLKPHWRLHRRAGGESLPATRRRRRRPSAYAGPGGR